MANQNPLDKGLPANIDVEKFILGSILLDDEFFADVVGKLQEAHFCLDKHQKIFRRMTDIHRRGEKIDRITVANELLRFSELESVDGLSYLVSLDDGLPKIPNLDGYIRIVRDKHALRQIIASAQRMMNQALLAEETPERIVQAAEASISGITSGLVTAKTAFSFQDVIDQEGGLDRLVGPRSAGIPTGYPCLDNLCFGFEPGLLYVIGGDSSHGKSTWAGNIALNVATGHTGTEWTRDPTPVGFFSLEMGREPLFRRMLIAKSKVSAWKMSKGFLDKTERARVRFTATELLRLPLYIDDCTGSGRGEEGGLSIRKFGARVRTMVREKQIKLAVLDYLQLLDWRADGLKSEYEGVTYATWYCKQLAKELKISVMVLSQFHQEYSRRKDKAARPTVDSMHASGSIKKDADVVWLLFRLSQAHPTNTEYRKTVEHIIAKQRDGKLGTILSEWERDQYRFDEKLDSEQPGFGEDS